MGKKNQRNKHKCIHKNIQSLNESRTGGQIALKGYSYQMLYSCYLLLVAGDEDRFQLEGIEDIDHVNETVSQVYNGAVFNDENYNELMELPWTELRSNNCDIK